MRLLFFTSLVLLAFQTHAASLINGSEWDPRIQKKLAEAVFQKCERNGSLQQILENQQIVQIDQGVTDRTVETTIQLTSRFEQNIMITFVSKVRWSLYDAYDHQDQAWGHFELTSVDCRQVP
ncbi:MAG: hypothetical protein ACK5Y2_04390 [Bdellovibrionales bacterium]